MTEYKCDRCGEKISYSGIGCLKIDGEAFDLCLRCRNRLRADLTSQPKTGD